MKKRGSLARSRLGSLAFVLLAGCAPRAPEPSAPVTVPSSAPPASSSAVAAVPFAPPPTPTPLAVACRVGDPELTVLAPDDPSLGPADAPITLIEFGDFQCPFCSRVVQTLAQVMEAYPGRIRIVWKNEPLPFHQEARPAAEAAQAVFGLAGAEAFFHFYDAAYADQKSLGNESYERWAREAGVADMKAFRDALASRRFSAKIDDDTALATKMGANGTPHFFINGIDLSGAQPFDKFKSVIDDELAAMEKAGSPTSCARIAQNFKQGAAREASATTPKPDDTAIYKVPVGTSPTRGPKTALVTIVEFGDYQCPFTQRAEETLAKVRTTYGDDVRIVWKDEPLPFHPRAEPSAELARETLSSRGVDAFWQVHDALFASAPELTDETLVRIGKDAKVDEQRVRHAVSSKKYHSQIETDQNLADDLKASGTPHFFVNGLRLVGAQPFEKWKSVIDDQLEKARALEKQGVPRSGIYDRIIKDGKGAEAPKRNVVPLRAKAPSRGAAGAKVVIQEFGDFQCPFCQRVQATLTELLKANAGHVRIVWRNEPLPFHKNARMAAAAALEVLAQKGVDAFWKMHDLLYEKQKEQGGLERTALEGYAQSLGCDMVKFRKALDDGTHDAEIEADEKAAKDAKLTGTPSFVIGPYELVGAQPKEKFQKLIDRVMHE